MSVLRRHTLLRSRTLRTIRSYQILTGQTGIQTRPGKETTSDVVAKLSLAEMVAQKRKRTDEPKFYAVRIGRRPGVYNSWAECLEQITGFANALFKSFSSLDEAQGFACGELVGRDINEQPKKWYAVRSGRVPGLYADWRDAQQQITGWKCPVFKSFATQQEANAFLGQDAPRSNTHDEDTDATVDELGTGLGQIKKIKVSKGKKTGASGASQSQTASATEWPPGERPLSKQEEDDFDRDVLLDDVTGELRYKLAAERKRTRYEAKCSVVETPIKIYTDGSSLGNGGAHSVAGIGVYFGPQDQRNISASLSGARQTNQRAELAAILRALEVAPRNRKAAIYSDSSYAIKCVTEWFRRWRTNGWLNSSKKPVENRDLIQKVIEHLENRCKQHEESSQQERGLGGEYWNRGAAGVEFIWIKGHAQDAGNIAADALAVAGARKAQAGAQAVQ